MCHEICQWVSQIKTYSALFKPCETICSFKSLPPVGGQIHTVFDMCHLKYRFSAFYRHYNTAKNLDFESMFPKRGNTFTTVMT